MTGIRPSQALSQSNPPLFGHFKSALGFHTGFPVNRGNSTVSSVPFRIPLGFPMAWDWPVIEFLKRWRVRYPQPLCGGEESGGTDSCDGGVRWAHDARRATAGRAFGAKARRRLHALV